MKPALLALVLAGSGCATARLAGEGAFTPPDRGEPRSVVVEPFFETAEWQTTLKTELVEVPGPLGFSGMPSAGRTVAVGTTLTEKPIFARVAALAEAHRQVIVELRRLRPSWQVTSTAGAANLKGRTQLVRVIVHSAELVESNRALKNLAFTFGLVLLPLQLFNLTPVEETQRVYGQVLRFELDAGEISPRLVRYPTQPDFAVNTLNLAAIEHRFGLDVTYEEGLLANEAPREGVLISGFALRLAAALVALVEER